MPTLHRIAPAVARAYFRNVFTNRIASLRYPAIMGPKRKRSNLAIEAPKTSVPIPLPTTAFQPAKRLALFRINSRSASNPEENSQILDGPDATRASPDSDVNDELASELSRRLDLPQSKTAKKKHATVPIKNQNNAGPEKKASTIKEGGEGLSDPEAEGEETVGEEELKEALSRSPPVNSDYLPLPWKGRLGYACLNTYLRYSNPPVFSSRTCRIASILEHRHPLKDPSQPEHATKNRPDKEKPADVERGQEWVQNLGLANARDIIKMLRWNDKFGIRFMRLSSEMFPFASHEEYGYKLAPFATEMLAEVGKVVTELGHRVTTHPGQFTQLGSPRKSVIDAAVRDLEFHDEMLSLLKLPPQQDRDAVMILHMGGMFGSKPETLDRFRTNYAKLSPSIKKRLVLENDDMSWSVHDLLPICQELNVPMVLDFHHHNIIFDAEKIREGTKDIVELFPAIRETWTKKGITQKMHYSEQTPAAITRMQRRKHSPRVATLPPCANDMDLMIEAKDKEQAVFELMRTFKLPGFDKIHDMIPHQRKDDNKPVPRLKKSATPKKRRKVKDEELDDLTEEVAKEIIGKLEEAIPEEEVGMGGPEKRVYWPPGMEEWLRPKKREVKSKGPAAKKAPKQVNAEPLVEELIDLVRNGKSGKKNLVERGGGKKREAAAAIPANSDEEASGLPDLDEEVETTFSLKTTPVRKSKRASKVSYAECEHSELE